MHKWEHFLHLKDFKLIQTEIIFKICKFKFNQY
jgi:hypothetical protein